MSAATNAGTFTYKTWEERFYTDEAVLPKLSTVESGNTYTGVIAAETVLRYTMIYLTEDTGIFTGLQTFTGTVDSKRGTFTVQEQGSWEGTTVTSRFTIIPGSGTGELSGISGSGEYRAVHGESAYPYTFEYTLGGA
jgi:hypothetical protein